MSWWNDFARDMECNAPLGCLTSFRVGGRARYLYRPRDVDRLAAMLRCARAEGIAMRVLGGGANVLVPDEGFDGVVVRLDSPRFRAIDWNGATVTIGAGVDVMAFARRCSSRGWSGLECMAGIPASVGGAVRMNAGGRFGDFGTLVREADVLRLGGERETWSRERLDFGYRSSAIDAEIVLAARLELCEDDPLRARERFDECLNYKRNTQPLGDHSAGCIFKNPDGQSAGALIDRAGVKGARRGRAYVSTDHANFIVARDGAKAADILALIDLMRERVRDDFGVELEVEVDIW